MNIRLLLHEVQVVACPWSQRLVHVVIGNLPKTSNIWSYTLDLLLVSKLLLMWQETVSKITDGIIHSQKSALALKFWMESMKDKQNLFYTHFCAVRYDIWHLLFSIMWASMSIAIAAFVKANGRVFCNRPRLHKPTH